MLRILLIDDEPPARDFLRQALADHPGTLVVGEAGTIVEARTQLARPDYDLVFLDIQLRGGNGFDLVPDVRAGARIIFATSYDRYALRAFTVNALDYLLKPIDPVRLVEALSRLAPPSGSISPLPVPAAPPSAVSPQTLPLAPTDILHVKTGAGTMRFVPLASVAIISTSDNYTELTLATGARHFVRRTLTSWADALPAELFVRVHRHTIVHLTHLSRVDRVTDETTHLTVTGVAEPVRASFRYMPELRARLAVLRRA
jgi:two-component system LytT family response regulator